MHWSEILAIILAVSILGAFLAVYIYKKVKKTPFTTCDCGKSKGRDLVKAYHKKYKKGSCCCQHPENN